MQENNPAAMDWLYPVKSWVTVEQGSMEMLRHDISETKATNDFAVSGFALLQAHWTH